MNCPKCGVANRPDAKFCAQCHTSLTAGDMAKACPRCRQANRMEAKYCVGCGYTFATPAPPVVSRQVALVAGGALIALVALIVGLVSISRARSGVSVPPGAALPTEPARPVATPASATDRALRATVQITTSMDGGRRTSAGSGSVLTETGHILTNFQVIGDI